VERVLGPKPNNPLGKPAGFSRGEVERVLGPKPNNPLGKPAGFAH